MATTQEVEMLRRQLTAQILEMRQQSSSTAVNAAVTGLTDVDYGFCYPVNRPKHDVSSADPLGLKALCLCVLCSNAIALHRL